MMKCLAELEDMAQKDEALREFLIILPNGRPHNGRFLDPFMGAIELNEAKGSVIWIDQLDKFNTKGIFV